MGVCLTSELCPPPVAAPGWASRGLVPFSPVTGDPERLPPSSPAARTPSLVRGLFTALVCLENWAVPYAEIRNCPGLAVSHQLASERLPAGAGLGPSLPPGLGLRGSGPRRHLPTPPSALPWEWLILQARGWREGARQPGSPLPCGRPSPLVTLRGQAGGPGELRSLTRALPQVRVLVVRSHGGGGSQCPQPGPAPQLRG